MTTTKHDPTDRPWWQRAVEWFILGVIALGVLLGAAAIAVCNDEQRESPQYEQHYHEADEPMDDPGLGGGW
jgi:predicted negative regulator of RcsB-dependent stress response